MLLTIIFIFIFLLFTCIVFNGMRVLRPVVSCPANLGVVNLPSVTVIVPAGTVQQATGAALVALVQQDYPCCELLFVTETADEPVAGAISMVLQNKHPSRPPCRHVISGPALTCSQKNHNLLAGIAAAAPQTEIFVFCDSTHIARPDWLRQLTAPLADGTADITSGYHRIVPQDTAIAGLGRSITVLILYMVQLLPGISQPWGGNMAIRRQVFDALKIRDLWAKTVVDDVTLARLLNTQGSAVRIVASAELATPLTGESLGVWTSWLTRQWLYLKFICPGAWAAAGCAVYLLAAGLAWSIVGILLLAVRSLCISAALPQLLCLLLFVGACMALRRLHLRPCPVLLWLAACSQTIFVVCWCHGRSIFLQSIDWLGKSYVVGRGGLVKKIRKM